MLMGHLRSKGIDVQRKRLREAIHRVDPVGVEERKANGIKRSLRGSTSKLYLAY